MFKKYCACFTLALALVLATACSLAGPRKSPSKGAVGGKKMENPEIVALVERSELAELSWPSGRAKQTLAGLPDAQAQLKALGEDPKRAWELRFKAYEALFALGGKLSEAEERRQAALVYATAIQKLGWHNAFELPGSIRSGIASRNLLALGTDAVAALRPLLHDQRLLRYEGSEEPTLSRLRGYRVADLAGALLGVLLNRPFPAEAVTAKERDEAIKGLE